MAKHLLKRYTPNPKAIREHQHLRWLAPFFEDPNLFHINRRSISGAFANGLFWAMIPLPLQMVAAAVTAIITRVNLPLSVALVWLTNPLTIPPIFYFNYLVGTWVLGTPPHAGDFAMTLEWIRGELQVIWLPLYLGSLITGLLTALCGFIGIRAYWRWHVIRRYQRKRVKINKVSQ